MSRGHFEKEFNYGEWVGTGDLAQGSNRNLRLDLRHSLWRFHPSSPFALPHFPKPPNSEPQLLLTPPTRGSFGAGSTQARLRSGHSVVLKSSLCSILLYVLHRLLCLVWRPLRRSLPLLPLPLPVAGPSWSLLLASLLRIYTEIEHGAIDDDDDDQVSELKCSVWSFCRYLSLSWENSPFLSFDGASVCEIIALLAEMEGLEGSFST